MTSHGSVLVVLMFVAALNVTSGCTTQKKEITVEKPPATVAVVTLSATDEDLAECVGIPLQRRIPALRFIVGKDFTKGLFPWFEPSVAPRDKETLGRLLAKPLVRSRIDSLGIRYVVIVEGQTNRSGGGGCMEGPICFGSWEKTTHLSGAVFNTQNFDVAGDIDTVQSGTSWFGLIAILPLGAPALTESTACEDFAKAAASFISSQDTVSP